MADLREENENFKRQVDSLKMLLRENMKNATSATTTEKEESSLVDTLKKSHKKEIERMNRILKEKDAEVEALKKKCGVEDTALRDTVLKEERERVSGEFRRERTALEKQIATSRRTQSQLREKLKSANARRVAAISSVANVEGKLKGVEERLGEEKAARGELESQLANATEKANILQEKLETSAEVAKLAEDKLEKIEVERQIERKKNLQMIRELRSENKRVVKACAKLQEEKEEAAKALAKKTSTTTTRPNKDASVVAVATSSSSKKINRRKHVPFTLGDALRAKSKALPQKPKRPEVPHPRDDVTAALAERLKNVLTENETVRERVRFLESTVSLLNEDIQNLRDEASKEKDAPVDKRIYGGYEAAL